MNVEIEPEAVQFRFREYRNGSLVAVNDGENTVVEWQGNLAEWRNQRNQKSDTLQRKNAENSKQIFPEKEYRGLSPNFHIHVSVSELYIPTMGLPFLLEEILGPILGIYKSLTDTWM